MHGGTGRLEGVCIDRYMGLVGVGVEREGGREGGWEGGRQGGRGNDHLATILATDAPR